MSVWYLVAMMYYSNYNRYPVGIVIPQANKEQCEYNAKLLNSQFVINYKCVQGVK